MGTNETKRILGRDGIPADQPERDYRLGDLRVSTNATPAQIFTNGAKRPDALAFAGFVGASIEFQKRDQEIAELKERLETTGRYLADSIGEVSALRKQVVALAKEVGSTKLQREIDEAVETTLGEEEAESIPEPVEGNGTERIELDPEEAERDYVLRQRKILAYFSKHPKVVGTAMAGTGIERELQLGGFTGDRPTLGELRKLEAYLNVHGGTDWCP